MNVVKICTVYCATMCCTRDYPSSSQEVKVRLRSIPPPKALEKALAARFIKTMASSSQDQPDLQFFFFAKHVRKMETIMLTL